MYTPEEFHTAELGNWIQVLEGVKPSVFSDCRET